MAFCNTVLLIDDDEVFNLITEHTLKTYDFADNIIVFTSVEEALAYFKNAVEEEGILIPEIIFLDINMPVQNGWEFLDAYRQFPYLVKKDVQLYMLSSSLDESDVEKSQQYEDVRDFIRKPLSKVNLEIIKFRLGNEKP